MITETARILMIDDDERLASLLGQYLRSHGHEVKTSHDGKEGLSRALSETWDLLILDVMLPGQDGFSVLKDLRRSSNLPVLMLTARGMDQDRIEGLEGGADDYVPKTTSAREILARVNALLRRSRNTVGASESLQLGDLTIRTRARRALLNGEELRLTPAEFDLLLALALHKGEVRSREELVEQLRDRRFSAADRSVDVHIAALRRKLGDDPRSPRYLHTVRTAGYMLTADPTPSTG